ncbi:F-type H+-transporting ATPase subunit gamma [Ereboglobus sp. PH5-5]|uniref:ATP synthase F1 subunit gamma n=1 Tax=Ereboglobus sp. PH5-5 TaxID=2940529 RepID=UPI002404E51A|nr:ATP synthase F1 subunit gamma [Ereboglobus sp. PH5-5]MDF9832227.1 F-type H+-transporting ATPase subunit gamma [Ereboglobus sp. PH5-5]
MPSTRDIRRRIKSVKNTRQITRAMELVASSKMKKAQQAAISGRPYASLLVSMIANIAPHFDESESIHSFIDKREIKTRGILLITTDKGLCGPLNTNLFKLISDNLPRTTPVKFVSIGRKGTQYLARMKRDMIADFPVSDRVTFAETRNVVQFMVKKYLEGEIDTIEVLYATFKNTLVQVPQLRPVLPLANLAQAVEDLRKQSGAEHKCDTREFIYEPGPKAVLDALLPFYVNRVIHQYFLGAKASEHSARMVAMKTAKDNASKLLDNLTLKFNKARQTAITNEIIEIAAASFAQQS